jgi:hypothetical protein
MDSPAEPPSALDTLHTLCSPALDPLFWPHSCPVVISAWHGHVPFACWLVGAARPVTLVELGTHHGGSYSAFCEAVLRHGLPTRCFAVDTWQGDEHAGRYGEHVFAELKRFHDERYAGFSTLVRATFDEAAATFAPGSVDLLHIDGLHTYAAVKHDFDTWLPKMSARGIMLFHDIAVHRDGFEVGRLWDELRQRYPSFSFAHCYGLGVLAVGAEVPLPVAELCRFDTEMADTVCQRFARLGETYELQGTLLINKVRALQNANPAGS